MSSLAVFWYTAWKSIHSVYVACTWLPNCFDVSSKATLILSAGLECHMTARMIAYCTRRLDSI